MGKSSQQYEAEIRKLKARIAQLEHGTRRRLEIETTVKRTGGVTRIVTVQKHTIDPTVDEKTVPSTEYRVPSEKQVKTAFEVGQRVRLAKLYESLPLGVEGTVSSQDFAPSGKLLSDRLWIDFGELGKQLLHYFYLEIILGDEQAVETPPTAPLHGDGEGRKTKDSTQRRKEAEGAKRGEIEIEFPQPSGKVLSFEEAVERAAAKGDFSADVIEQLKAIGDRQAVEAGKAVYQEGREEWQRNVPLLGSGEQ